MRETTRDTSRRKMDEGRVRAREETAAWEARESASRSRREWIKAVLVAAVSLAILFLLQVNAASEYDYDGEFTDAMIIAGMAVGIGLFWGFFTLFVMGWFLGLGGGTLGLVVARMLALASFFVLCLFVAGPAGVIWSAIPAFAFSSVMCYWLFDFEMTEAGLLTGIAFVLSLTSFVIIAFTFDF